MKSIIKTRKCANSNICEAVNWCSGSNTNKSPKILSFNVCLVKRCSFRKSAKLNDVMADTGFGVTATNRGVAIFPYDPAMDPKEAGKILRSKRKELTEIYPSSPEMSMTTTGYVPGICKRSPEGPLSTAPYSGEATSDVLRAFADLHPSVAQNISESESVRQAIRDKALRDSLMGGTRGDIQESRRFFSEADWPKAVEMIRKGMSPAAALAALGYSASSMAGEQR